ncbi:hypothetical protein BDD12DRAFT_889161 [Trichophaea hybrida]|nr:hypothetical protein BDD12DRAFT_889161 [Trichophaea hybrida]
MLLEPKPSSLTDSSEKLSKSDEKEVTGNLTLDILFKSPQRKFFPDVYEECGDSWNQEHGKWNENTDGTGSYDNRNMFADSIKTA